MRRRIPQTPHVRSVFKPPRVPEFVDDVSLSGAERVARWEAWKAKYYDPWAKARDEYEEASGVIVLPADHREFYRDERGFAFVEGAPECPDSPWDPNEI